MAKRVVVTGVGAVTPLGCGIEHVWRRILAGECGINKLAEGFLPPKVPVFVAGQVPRTTDSGDLTSYCEKAVFGRSVSKELSVPTQFGVLASDLALAHAGNPLASKKSKDLERAGVVMATGGVGSLADIISASDSLNQSIRRLSPYFIPKVLTNMAGGHISIRHGLKGPSLAPSTACAASSHAVGEAYNLIRLGYADLMLAGGTEACLDPLSISGFARLRALSPSTVPKESSRPFDKDRNGFVMAEGACVLVLEEYHSAKARGATIIAELCGYGMSADAHHATAPSPGGEGAARSMAVALRDAGISADEVGYVNCHATSTPQGDEIEAAAVQRTFFGEKSSRDGNSNPLYVSSTKGATGHLLGAAGALELGFTALALRDGILPPTLNLDCPDPEEAFITQGGGGLQYVAKNAIQAPGLTYALKNSFGFGGTNASIVLSRSKEEKL